MIRSTIRTQVRQMCNDLHSVRYTDETINTWIDIGNTDLAARIGADRAMATITTVVNEPNYQLPTTAMVLREVYFTDSSGQEKRLEVVDQDELNSIFGTTWRSDSSGVPQYAFLADYNVLGLHHTPNSDNANRTIRVFYERMPSDLASDSDAPIFINALHDSLTFFCAARGYFQIGDVERGEYFYKKYEQMANNFKNRALEFSKDLNQFRWT